MPQAQGWRGPWAAWLGGSCPLFSKANRQPVSLFCPCLLRFLSLAVQRQMLLVPLCIPMLINAAESICSTARGEASALQGQKPAGRSCSTRDTRSKGLEHLLLWQSPNSVRELLELFLCTAVSALQVLCLQTLGSRSAKQFCNS